MKGFFSPQKKTTIGHIRVINLFPSSSDINQCSKKINRTSSDQIQNGNKINFTHLQLDKKQKKKTYFFYVLKLA